MEKTSVNLNGVTYRWPSRPVVVVCIDGGDPEYFEHGLEAGIIPNIERFMKEGFSPPSPQSTTTSTSSVTWSQE